MITKKTQVEIIQELKEEVMNSNYEKIECYSNGRYETVKLIGTTYLKEKMDYGFHIYHIHEPNKNNQLAGVNGTLSEMYYDLRNRVYWIKRNNKEVKFSPRNVDAIFNQHSSLSKIFNLISTENNKGLYHSAYKELGKIKEEKTEMFGRFFHRLITNYSYFELLHKAGVKVSHNYRVANPNGTSPREILGLSKTKWKMVSQYGLEPRNIVHYDEKHDTRMLSYLAYVRKLEDEYGIEKMKEFVANEMKYIYDSRDEYYSAVALSKRYGLSEKRVVQYIYFECDVSQGLSSSSAQYDYKDYLRMVTEMEYEKYDKYPKFLRTMHDIVARNYNIKLDDIQKKQWVDKAEEQLQKYKYTYNGYKIIVPTEPSELIKEGNVLSHCVGSYIGRVLKGQCDILFLRESRDESHPLVTIEVVGDRISQARGKMNYPPTEEQKRAIESFAKKYELEYKTA